MVAIPRLMPRGGIGIEIGPRRLRAVRLGGRRSRHVEAMEIEWSAEVPDDAVAALRERFGSGARIAVAVDMSALFVKRLTLPALPPAQRRRMIALEPERYFPVRDEAIVVGVRHDDLVVAARAERFNRMTEALGSLGEIERVEPAPAAVARHLAASGITHALMVLADPHDQDCSVVGVRDGQVAGLRKLPGNAQDIAVAAPTVAEGAGRCFLYPWQQPLAEELARQGLAPEPVPIPPGCTEEFAGASGALLGLDGSDDLTLSSPALERRRAVRAWRRGLVASAALLAAIAVGLWSVDLRRERTLTELERRIGTQQAAAAEVQQLLADVAAAQEEVTRLATVSRERQDPLEVLLLLTRLLPGDAHLRGLHGAGDEWELDGYARDAASLIPTLEESDALTDVRFRTATTRVQLGDQNYESFSLALRYARPSQ